MTPSPKLTELLEWRATLVAKLVVFNYSPVDLGEIDAISRKLAAVDNRIRRIEEYRAAQSAGRLRLLRPKNEA